MSTEPEPLAPAAGGGSDFATTHWSVVLAAGASEDGHSTQALEQLCRGYWYPLYAFVRRRGHRPEDAQDLTQAYFARLLEKHYVRQANPQRGRFRTFLLSALSHFLADEWDRTQRLKRGGGRVFVSMDATDAEERYRLEPIDALDAVALFERRWATTLLERAMARLEQEYAKRGQDQLVQELGAFLVGDRGDATYAEMAPRFGLTVAAMKMAASRMRSRCRELLREEIAQTVSDPQEAEDEYRALVAALGR